jgi:hypothetical protein
MKLGLAAAALAAALMFGAGAASAETIRGSCQIQERYSNTLDETTGVVTHQALGPGANSPLVIDLDARRFSIGTTTSSLDYNDDQITAVGHEAPFYGVWELDRRTGVLRSTGFTVDGNGGQPLFFLMISQCRTDRGGTRF